MTNLGLIALIYFFLFGLVLALKLRDRAFRNAMGECFTGVDYLGTQFMRRYPIFSALGVIYVLVVPLAYLIAVYG